MLIYLLRVMYVMVMYERSHVYMQNITWAHETL
jgi:hypothetical protein